MNLTNVGFTMLQVLLQFHDCVERITKDLYMHRLCEYLYEVATTFSEFYDNCYCVERDSEGMVEVVSNRRRIFGHLIIKVGVFRQYKTSPHGSDNSVRSDGRCDEKMLRHIGSENGIADVNERIQRRNGSNRVSFDHRDCWIYRVSTFTNRIVVC